MCLLAAALLLPRLGAAPFERAEIYFLDAARAMVERSDFVVPYYRGEVFFDKPALTYWLTAAAFRVFGFTPEAGRLVPVLASFGAILATVALGMVALERRAALTGGLILLTTLAFLSFGRVAMSDMLLTLWSTLAVALGLALYRPTGNLGRRALMPTLGLVLGLGFLTKGPVALLLPGLALLLILWQKRREPLPSAVTPGATALSALLFGVVGLGWFVLVQRRLGWGPLQYFFLRENLERFAGDAYDAGKEPWFYLSTYLAEGLPWSLFFPAALIAAARQTEDDAGRRGTRFLASWILLMLVPLSLSRGKIDYYLLPLYPAASLILGHYFTAVPWRRLERTWARVSLLLCALAFAGIATLPARLPGGWLPAGPARAALAVAAGLGSLGCLWAAWRPAPARVAAALAAPTGAVFFVLVAFFLPAFRAAQPNAAILEDVARERAYRKDASVALCKDPARVQRDLLFHDRLNVWERCALWEPASSKRPFMLLLASEERASLSELPGMRTVREYSYLPATALTLGGLLRLPDPGTLLLVANYPTVDPVAEAKRRRARKQALLREEEEEGRPREGVPATK